MTSQKPAFDFTILSNDKETKARLGLIKTPHGTISTPAFVPVGTQATVKSLTPQELIELGTEIFFVNTYHMYLRPGVAVIQKFGGLHQFMRWSRPLITDSGGFQVFSLGSKRFAKNALSENTVINRRSVKHTPLCHQVDTQDRLVNIDDDGVTFTSHWDGSTHRFTPEISIQIQHQLGADIMIAFDECTPYPTTHDYAAEALSRSHDWSVRSLAAHQSARKKSQALYGVVQGSVYEDLRKASADFIGKEDFDGIAIGGVSVGESKEEMRQVCDWVIPRLPPNKPRHLLGVGEVDDIFDIVERGIDTFDCVMPTRLARMGQILTMSNKNKYCLNDMTKKVFATDQNPLAKDCPCYTCKNFSRAYIHHLFRVHELLAYRLATIHNLYFVHTLVRDIRQALSQGTYIELRKKWLV